MDFSLFLASFFIYLGTFIQIQKKDEPKKKIPKYEKPAKYEKNEFQGLFCPENLAFKDFFPLRAPKKGGKIDSV